MIKQLKIKNIILKNNLILAPMAGYTDAAMRRLCREAGAGLAVTEMVSVKGLLYENKNTADLLRLSNCETPSCVQLFGSDPEVFGEVIRNNEQLAPFDIIDINMGCPVKKVVSSGDGSKLLADPKKAAAIVAAAAKATNRPITVKIRIPQSYYQKTQSKTISLPTFFDYKTSTATDGYQASLLRSVPQEQSENSIACTTYNNDLNETINILSSNGASMITVHGRTAKMMYSGLADWNAINDAAAHSPVPLIGNGDIITQNDIKNRLNLAVSGIMIGRGAIGNPYIFSLTQNNSLTQTITAPSSSLEEDHTGTACSNLSASVNQTAKRHINYMIEYYGERYTVINMRKHLAYYVKGLPNMRDFKSQINYATSSFALISLIDKYIKD